MKVLEKSRYKRYVGDSGLGGKPAKK
uniref:Uncharacterized protein n=1 Tax=Anguilla anguilla TaxID=7936 RepID=A0A0E9S386_ANGAN